MVSFLSKDQRRWYAHQEEIWWMQWNKVKVLYKCRPFTICLGGYKECYRFCGSALNVTEESNGFKTAGSGSCDLTPIPLRHSTTVNYFKGQGTLILLSSSEGKSLWFSKTCSQSELVGEFLPYTVCVSWEKRQSKIYKEIFSSSFFSSIWDSKLCKEIFDRYAYAFCKSWSKTKLCHATSK